MNTKKPKLNDAARQHIKALRNHRKTRAKVMKEITTLSAQIEKLNDKLTRRHQTAIECEQRAIDELSNLINALVACGFAPEDAFDYATELK